LWGELSFDHDQTKTLIMSWIKSFDHDQMTILILLRH